MGRLKHKSNYALSLFILGVFFKLLILSTLFTVTSVGDAAAKKSDQCSANGQKPCPTYYPGERCDAWLSEQGGICRPCGGKNQESCPVIKKGERCKANLSKNSSGICVGCGGLNEKSCPVIKGGERCNAGLSKNSRGLCTPCGGRNEKACPVIKGGTVCESGLGKINGICRPCGLEGQLACPAVEVGRQCELWTTKRGDYCRPCGDVGTKACRITDKGKACKPGLKRTLDGVCVFDEKEMIRINAEAKLEELGGQILPAIFEVFKVSQNESLMESVKNEDPAAESYVPEDNNLCFGDGAQTWSLSVEADAAFFVGIEGEVGMAWRCADFTKERKDSKWFANSGYNLRGGFGGGASATLGFWQDDVENLRGKSHGYVFDIKQLFENATGGLAAEYKKEMDKLQEGGKADFSPTIGFWFADYDKDDPRSIENAGLSWRPRFIGWTVSGGFGHGWDAGVTYSKIKTVQVCLADMKCAEGVWEGDGKTLIISGQTKDGLYGREAGSDANRYFERVLVAGRKYKTTSGSEKIIRYRKNYTLLKYDDGINKYKLTKLRDLTADDLLEGDTAARNRTGKSDVDASRPGNEEQAGNDNLSADPVATINVLGRWSYQAGGKTHTDDILMQADGYIIARRVGTNYLIRYKKSGSNSYQSAGGSELRFVSGTRALWVSPDRKTVFQWQKQ